MNDIQQTEATATLNDCHIFASLSPCSSLTGRQVFSKWPETGEPQPAVIGNACVDAWMKMTWQVTCPFHPIKLQIDPVLQFSREKSRLS